MYGWNNTVSVLRFSKLCFVVDLIIDKDQDINALLQDGKWVSEFSAGRQFKNDDYFTQERIDDTYHE